MKNNSVENQKSLKNQTDENLNNKIIVIQNDKSKSIIFQAEYAKEFSKTDSTQYVFFDIDKKTVKYIEENLKVEYCKTFKNWSDNLYGYIIETAKQRKDKKTAEEYQVYKDEIEKNCEINSNELEYYDKQMIGINNIYGNKAICIQLLDLRNDTENLKNSIESNFILGYDGWFESNNRKIIIFLIDEKKFVVSKEDK